MKSFHNIERSAFHRGQYVGFADGAWNIRRDGNGWMARPAYAKYPAFHRRTLAEVSAFLDTIVPERSV